MKALTLPLAIVLLAACLVVHAQHTPGFKVATPTGFTSLATSGNSVVYTAQGTGYNDPVLVAVLRGDRHTIGYDYGKMLGTSIKEMYTTFMERVIGKRLDIVMLQVFIDWQWHSFLSQETPQDFKDEIAGIRSGCEAIRVSDCDAYVTRVIALANAPGDADDFLDVLEDEFMRWLHDHELIGLLEGNTYADVLRIYREAARKLKGCSMFGLWGSRTVSGDVYSGRNLDWTKDSGISKFKLMTVYVPDGASPHATLGFVGFWGALAGMSKSGLTVHEANLEESVDTFVGFPWSLRLRWIMEHATSLHDGVVMWAQSNNTCGFNHQLCSANDKMCVLMETMAGYTAYFTDNDEREANAMYNNTQGQIVHLGRPLPHATMRTNHGYDPTIRKTYNWKTTTHAFQDSVNRYFMLSEQVSMYEVNNIPVGYMQAINTTSLLGHKGGDYYVCNPSNYPQGSNILSVAFWPTKGMLYSAWEDGSAASWSPAACNTYVVFDMSKFW